MVFTSLEIDFSVCKINDTRGVDFTRDFVFLSKTDEEISLVCPSDYVPPSAIAVEAGWKAFRIEGILDFGLVGIVADITGVLANAGISVFVISTYNTDYVFIKSHDFDKGLALLRNGY
ncbi:MAG: ACT domain-containing protein [Oscillospiraceae bacterium]|nr:ACT domain-containing protein [Oscillospiraceae bacterium]